MTGTLCSNDYFYTFRCIFNMKTLSGRTMSNVSAIILLFVFVTCILVYTVLCIKIKRTSKDIRMFLNEEAIHQSFLIVKQIVKSSFYLFINVINVIPGSYRLKTISNSKDTVI